MSEMPKIDAVIKPKNPEIPLKVEGEKEKIKGIDDVLNVASQEAEVLALDGKSESGADGGKAEKIKLLKKKLTALCVGMSIFAGTFAGMPADAEAGGRGHSSRNNNIHLSDVLEAGVATVAVSALLGVASGANYGMERATEKVILNSAGIETDQQRYDRYRYEALQQQRVVSPQYGYVQYRQPPQGYYQPPAYQHISGENPRFSQPSVERGHNPSSNKIEYHKALVKAGEKLNADKDNIFNKYVDSSGKPGEMSKEEYDNLTNSAEEKYKSQVEILKETYLGQQGAQKELSDEKVPKPQLEQQDSSDDGIKTEELGEDFEREKYEPSNRDDL